MCTTSSLLTISSITYVKGAAFPSFFFFFGYDCGVNAGFRSPCSSDRFIHKNILYRLAISEICVLQPFCLILYKLFLITSYNYLILCRHGSGKKKRKSNCSTKKEVIEIVAESERSNLTCSNMKRRKSNCSDCTKK
jgi:hypothetical protein